MGIPERGSIRELFTSAELRRLDATLPQIGLVAGIVAARDVEVELMKRAARFASVDPAHSHVTTLMGIQFRVSDWMPAGSVAFVDREGRVLGVINGLM
jgi:hypothetical protein